MEKQSQENSGQKQKQVSRTSIRSAFLGLLLVVVIIGIVVAGVSFVLQQNNISQAEQHLADNSVQMLSQGITSRTDGYRKLVNHLSRESRIVELMQVKDLAALEQAAAEVTVNSAHIMKVRYLLKDHSDTDNDPVVPLTFASLDMANRAARSGEITVAEIHAPNSPAKHIALAGPVRNTSGKTLGAVLVAFDPQELLDQINQLKSPGLAVALIQKSGDHGIELARSNGFAAAQGKPVRIAGSIWELHYQPLSAVSFLGKTLAAIVILAGTLVVGGMLFFNQMKLRKALAYDQNLMLEIVENKLAGKQKNLFTNYALDENKDTIKQLSQLDAAAVEAKQKPATPRTADAEDDGAPVFPSQVSQSEGQSANVEDISGSAISEEIFRKYDIRGVVGDTLSLEHAYVIGKAIGSLAIDRGETDMLVARDGRISSKDLSSTLIRGICESGVNVVDLGLMPTPVMYFGTNFLSAKSGVMVTGSHNPPDYNGFKIVIGGNTLSGEDIAGLHGRIVTGRFNSGEGSKDELDISADYINRISEDVQLLKPMKVVLDCGHGAASVIARSLFEALNCEVISQYCEVDGNFPAHHPDPGKEENMAELAKAVVEEHADLGIAFDGDGDRLGVVDSSGNIIKPDRVLMILAGDVLLRNPGADVLYDVKSTKLLASHILSSGGRPIMWKSGHSLMKAKMKETGALLGGEFSGHMFFTERWYGFDDALYSAARLLEVVSGDGRSSADMFAEIPDTINTPELHVSVAEGMQHTIMEKLAGASEKAFPNAKITDIDGIRAEYSGAWGLIRASNTTPHLVLRFEADNQEAMDKVQEVFRTVIKAVLPTAEIPF